MTVFKLPDLGEGLSEAEILRWHVQVGDHIEVDAPMLAVETAKAVVEVPSPVSGTIVALHASPGDRIEIGAPLIEFTVDAPAAGSEPLEADAGTVVGHMPAPQQVPDSSPTAPARARGAAAPASRVKAAPAARALARSLGVELESLTGTGRDGLIMLDDVLAAGSPARARAHAASAAGSPARATPRVEGQLEALRSLRRTMAQTMSLARDNVAACTVFDDADLHRWPRASDYTMRVLRAIVSAVRAEPGLNAWYDSAAQTRTIFQHVDVGVAVDTPDGLLMPVIRHVEKLDPPQVRAELERLKRAAHERTLRTDELRDFTFMLSNFGTMVGRYATPVIVPPAIAILGAGRVRQDVLAVQGRVEIRARMPLSLTFDHRVVTGGEAVRFLGALMADLEREE
jgi:pyruvate dehydrogenase E2 component (dihydrolipoamide acetyltransferase)